MDVPPPSCWRDGRQHGRSIAAHFAGLIDPADAGQYIAGLILLGAAPCTAMIFVWSQMMRGAPNHTPVQVSLNDVVMIFAFPPIVALLLGGTDLAVPWETLPSRPSRPG